jgi:hypothetical protein
MLNSENTYRGKPNPYINNQNQYAEVSSNAENLATKNEVKMKPICRKQN